MQESIFMEQSVHSFVPTTELPGYIDYAAWLSPDVLLMIGWFDMEPAAALEATLVFDETVTALEVIFTSYYRPDILGRSDRIGKILIARFRSPEHARRPLGSLIIRSGDEHVRLQPHDLSATLVGLEVLIERGLKPLPRQGQTAVLELLVSPLNHAATMRGNLRLSKSLQLIREALRERLPAVSISRDEPQGLFVDAILAVDERGFYIRGWLRDVEAPVTDLLVISPEGSQVQCQTNLFRYPRHDVAEFYGDNPQRLLHGFICYVELDYPSQLASGWLIQLRNALGVAVEATAPPVTRDLSGVRNVILNDLALENLPHDTLIRYHVHPAMSRLQKQAQALGEIADVREYGHVTGTPEVSIIIPLYGRVDFLEQQLAQFVHDPELAQAELIYVLDSPELAEPLYTLAAQLFRLYRVPFRIVTMQQNVGYSGANNAGASVAQGRLLLLLNSDVLPVRPGWLTQLARFYDSTPGIGALGAKLLYEDGSLQHAGIYFHRPEGSYVWVNEHYFKGFQGSLPAANLTRTVPAVTGACMMIDAAVYRHVGGLQQIYVQGDYEDSDLCLRLLDAGYENWYLPTVELYHLEGQSYPGIVRQLARRYNLWLHTFLWNEQIEQLMSRYNGQTDSEITFLDLRNNSAKVKG
jgi:GT2 family glycosyltransferase